ncbi:hypothetical protein BKA70DRAFT_1409395 [Coprinopsis sp. MPI-PUGE-AT-0042]|nr:hypothetical protein BKA70DRAFT_1409395 [Coprinopsis sp. MPI-PUGE-AT-0042]
MARCLCGCLIYQLRTPTSPAHERSRLHALERVPGCPNDDAKLLNCKSLKPFSDTGGSRAAFLLNPGFDAQARREPSNQRVVNGQERVMQQERDLQRKNDDGELGLSEIWVARILTWAGHGRLARDCWSMRAACSLEKENMQILLTSALEVIRPFSLTAQATQGNGKRIITIHSQIVFLNTLNTEFEECSISCDRRLCRAGPNLTSFTDYHHPPLCLGHCTGALLETIFERKSAMRIMLPCWILTIALAVYDEHMAYPFLLAWSSPVGVEISNNAATSPIPQYIRFWPHLPRLFVLLFLPRKSTKHSRFFRRLPNKKNPWPRLGAGFELGATRSRRDAQPNQEELSFKPRNFGESQTRVQASASEPTYVPLMPDSMGRVEVSSACPINDLPPELFSEILVYVIRPKKVLPFEELHAELTSLSLVCGTWLQAVRRESRLWTSCQLRFDAGRCNPTPQLMAALAAFYARSASLPLVLFITIQSYNNSEHGQFAALTDFIWAYAGRWDDLNLMTTADHGHEWAPSVIFRATEGAKRVNPFRNVTSFKYMHLVDGTGSENHFPQRLRLREAFPMLWSLDIIVPEPSKFKFAIQYLLMLTLEKFTLAGYMGSAWDLHSILDQAPQLDYLDFDDIAAQRLFSVLTHSCLTTLRLRSPFIVTNEFGTLCMPSLASLGISNSLHDEEDKPFDASLVLSAIRQMVDRSACQLKELQWRDMCIGVKHTRALLEMFPTLETLTIWDELKTFVAILKDLQETKSDNPVILPRLSNLAACVIGSRLTPRQQGKIKEQILPLMKREHRGSPVSVDTTSAGIQACSARIESTNISCWLNGHRVEFFSV